MKKRELTNLPASVHQRLLNLAREMNRPFNELLQYYVMERFLFRLSHTPYAERFVLKGALMLRAWDVPLARPTMDIDMLGRLPNSVENLVEVVRECLVAEVPDDGLRFAATHNLPPNCRRCAHPWRRPGRAEQRHPTSATTARNRRKAWAFPNCRGREGRDVRPGIALPGAVPIETSAANCPSLRATKVACRACATDR